MVVAQALRFQQFEQVRLHQALHDIDIRHLLDRRRTQHIPDIDDVFMLEPVEDLDFAQRPLAVGLMFERGDFLDGEFLLRDNVKGSHHHSIRAFPDKLQINIAWSHIENLAPYFLHTVCVDNPVILGYSRWWWCRCWSGTFHADICTSSFHGGAGTLSRRFHDLRNIQQ